MDAAGQRPVNSNALEEPSGEPAWKTIPSWFIYAERDLAIPGEAGRFMAKRAKSHSVEVKASHAVHVSKSHAVADLIDKVARATNR